MPKAVMSCAITSSSRTPLPIRAFASAVTEAMERLRNDPRIPGMLQ